MLAQQTCNRRAKILSDIFAHSHSDIFVFVAGIFSVRWDLVEALNNPPLWLSG